MRGAIGVFLLGLGTAWSAGNVGPVVDELADDFDLSLATIGVLSGTLFFSAMVIGIVVAPRAAERIGIVHAMRLACLVAAVGSVVFAFSPEFPGLAIGRFLAGIGLGFAGVLGPVYARATGGIGRVGLFGASFQLGIAGGLGVGSVLADSGVDWRVGFVITAAIALSSIPFLQAHTAGIELERGHSGFLRAAVGSPQVLRLALLFIAMFGVPLTLGAWLVHYLTEDGGLRAGVAGGLAFLLFGLSALLREVGGKLAGRGVSPVLLAGMMPWLAAAGLAAIALDQSFAVVLVAVTAMGLGFALPYAVMIVEAQRLYPPEPAQPTALLTMVGSGVAIATIPLVGAALTGAGGMAAFLAMAALVAAAGIANLRPAGKPVTDEQA